MTLIDAIKMGGKIRNQFIPRFENYCTPDKNLFTSDDIQSPNWEAEPKAISLLVSDIRDAYIKAYMTCYPIGTPDIKVIKELLRNLGFKL